MRWNEWQAWWTSSGRRPRQAVGGYTVSQAQESALQAWMTTLRQLVKQLQVLEEHEQVVLLGPRPSVLLAQAVVQVKHRMSQ